MICGVCEPRACPCHTTPGVSRCVVCQPVNPDNVDEVQRVGEMLRPARSDPDFVDPFWG